MSKTPKNAAARDIVTPQDPARLAVAAKGRLRASKWLLLRRVSQALALVLFLTGPLLGVWIMRGTLASSEMLGVVPFTDPLVFLQSLAAGHGLIATAWIGAALLVALYVVVGGRAFCSWVCPVNVLTDGAHRLRVRLGIKQGLQISRSARLWALAAVVAVSALAGSMAWEVVNPVTLLHRELVFGVVFTGSLAWMLIGGVVLFDIFAANRGWCGHLCPVGAAYGLIGTASLTRVSAKARNACDKCMACYHVCPEPHVINPALKGGQGETPVILSRDCTNCGRCIDICHRNVFAFTHRFDHRRAEPANDTEPKSRPAAPAAAE
ncbi:quinol dehydrogenase ferredoxin subunit NapH [Caenispirillum salinarum]|uniref:quinol dehydrogenase ferredoxin subunit NapH n=1 Tax=Caenispirillum salinarum TaxID=859058 RepID=UPI00384F7449